MSWSDYLGSQADGADQLAAADASEADLYLDAAQQDIADGFDPSGDLSDAGANLGNASDEELSASDLSADAVDAAPIDDMTAGGGGVWDPALDA